MTKLLETEIKDVQTFYIVMEDDTNDVLDDDGHLSGGYSYDEWSNTGKLVLSYLSDCKMFTNKAEADKEADRLRKFYQSDFTVLKVVKSLATLYSLEH